MAPGEGRQIGQVWLTAPTENYLYYRITYTDEYGAVKRSSATKDYGKALDRAHAIDAALTAGTAVRSSTVTFGTAWAQYVQAKAPNISLEYTAQLERAMKTKLAPLRSTQLRELRYQHIQRVLDDITAAGGTAKTQKRVVSQLNPFLKWSYVEKLLPRAPIEYTERLTFSVTQQYARQDDTRGSTVQPDHVFTMEEVYRISEAALTVCERRRREGGNARNWDYATFGRSTHLAILLTASTGLRQGEMRALEVGDFRADNTSTTGHGEPYRELANAHISRSYREHAGGFKEIRRPKGGKSRTIYVPTWTAPIDGPDHRPRSSRDILEKYGAPSDLATEDGLRHAKARAVNLLAIRRGFLADLRTIRHRTPGPSTYFWKVPDNLLPADMSDPYEALRDVSRRLMRVDDDGNLAVIGGEPLQRVRTLPRRLHTKEFIDLWDDGAIQPVREMIDTHIKALLASTPEFWKPPHTDNHQVGPAETALMWASVRPPRSNTRLPISLPYLNPNGCHIAYSASRSLWQQIVDQSGISNPKGLNGQARTMRNLRHTFATQALRTGTPVSIISAQLGHSNSATTLQRYTKVMRPGSATPIML
ncbi:hypothetical protein nbrc107696_32880 [Gordonia spumicola]|uniref:Integrase n=2 Tax=Gordonia spumicola TaxID=589161 RepID=A0A7I9VCC5_9ACTN|nr:hypothetical protein nbrc107696_32880 [Gordonia spumicola]